MQSKTLDREPFVSFITFKCGHSAASILGDLAFDSFSVEFFRLVELLLSRICGALPRLVPPRWRPGILRATLFPSIFTIPEFLEMAPLLLFEELPASAEAATSVRAEGFWESKVAEPSIANRFELSKASEELVGFTIVGLEPATAGSRDSNEGWLLRLRRSRANRNHLSYNRPGQPG